MSIALYASLNTRFPNQYRGFIAQWSLLVLPLLLSVTLFANTPLALSTSLALPTAALLLCLPHRDVSSPLPSQRPPHTPHPIRFPPIISLTVYRAHMMLMTILAILAVDFPVFPRSLAKCESFGVSLVSELFMWSATQYTKTLSPFFCHKDGPWCGILCLFPRPRLCHTIHLQPQLSISTHAQQTEKDYPQVRPRPRPGVDPCLTRQRYRLPREWLYYPATIRSLSRFRLHSPLLLFLKGTRNRIRRPLELLPHSRFPTRPSSHVTPLTLKIPHLSHRSIYSIP